MPLGMGDKGTYDNVIVLRIVEIQDAMTADWAHIPRELLAKISNRIINEEKGVNRVYFDIFSNRSGGWYRMGIILDICE